mgnify:CR=1 FL=1
MQKFQIPCQFFVLREQKSHGIARSDLKDFKNGETSNKEIYPLKRQSFGKKPEFLNVTKLLMILFVIC